MIARLLFATLLLAAPPLASAWNVSCLDEEEEKCPDGYAKVRTPWSAHPQSEHRRLFERTLELAGLPASLLETFQLTVHADDATLFGEEGRSYKSIRPVRSGARHIVLRELSVQAMSNLPDNSYTLWDWASGNEICPPDRGNADALDCHNYETHIGWLNSNHMLPQSQRFYEHLHRLALDRAKECKAMHGELAFSADELERFEELVLACEKEALILEAVGHHYLQDSWSMGHMWERWGGVEIADFRGSRPLGFAIAAFTGTIHGAGAMIPFGAADDPMCAPHPDDNYVDDPDGVPREHPGVGDVYLEEFLFQGAGQWAPQRRALFGCAVDGVRAVYAETAQVHGAMQAADAAEVDGSRHVTDLTCWRQRATNKAIATGCGIHLGTFPNQVEVLSGAVGGAAIAGILPLALSTVLAEVAVGLEQLPTADAARFAADAAYACTLAAAHAAIPGIAEQTNLADGGLPSLVGVQPNSFYARGNAFSTPLVPPSSYADPALPWELDATVERDEKEALNLTFADAHAADRCRTFTVADLNVYRSEVELAEAESNPDVLEARCSQCAQLVAPHLRFGVEGNHDPRREAFCAFVASGSTAFAYTDEDPATFTDDEDTSYDASRTAARAWCGCGSGPCPTDVELDFGTGEPDPTVPGPILENGASYRITVSGTYTFNSVEQWGNGVCRGEAAAGEGGPTGLDSEYFFAIPVGSSLCDEEEFECCPNHTEKFRISLDGGGTFEHLEPLSPGLSSSHVYEYEVQGQGMPVQFQLDESNNRGDDYGILRISVACASSATTILAASSMTMVP